MSSIYHTEPPTVGKVLVKTNFGDIDIELWPKEAPLACRNFIQLALEGYYDNTNVCRVVKGFMVQMGDPTGTGAGGESIWGRSFKDEIHGRIKFNHRGQVAMANGNKPNSNDSQFFITLDNCDWLNGKHTIFGKVTGATIFNVLRMGDVEVDGKDKPLDNIIIKQMEVLSNPFDDITPRVTQKRSNDVKVNEKQERKSKLKSVKNTKLLSFMQDSDDDANRNDEEDDDSEGEVVVKIKSIHDLKKKKKADQNKDRYPGEPSITTKPSVQSNDIREQSESIKSTQTEISKNAPPKAMIASHKDRSDAEEDEEDNAKAFDRKMRQQIMKKMNAYDSHDGTNTNNLEIKSSYSSNSTKVNKIVQEEGDEIALDKNSLQDIVDETMKENHMKQSHEEFYKLRQQLLQSKRAIHVLTGSEKAKQDEDQAFHEMIAPLEQRRMKYQKRKTDYGDRASETMARLSKFTTNLRQSKQEHDHEDGDSEKKKKKNIESYHGQVLESDEDEKIGSKRKVSAQHHSDDEEETTLQKEWFLGKLKCKKHIDHEYRKQSILPGALGSSNITHGHGADGRSMDDYILHDPRKK